LKDARVFQTPKLYMIYRIALKTYFDSTLINF